MTYQRPAIDHKKAEDARPKLGTPFGDEFIGHCAHPLCMKRVRRHEAFIVTLADDVFHCTCWATVQCKDLSKP